MRLENTEGLEIGGPTPYFVKSGLVPLYPILSRVDHCNISRENFNLQKLRCREEWEIDLLTLDASNTDNLGRSYGVIFNSHVLEHIANPLKAIKSWKKNLAPGGYLLLILPYKKNTFDHRRKLTSFAHLLEDYTNQTKEDDMSHLPEILKFHDIDKDPSYQEFEEFKEVALRNPDHRILHHHVFDPLLARETVEWAGGNVLMSELVDPISFLILAQFP